MRILVTGGTGFVGSHSAAALIRNGHEVRLLVRSPEKVGPVFERLGVEVPADVVRGDVTDPASIAGAIEGCEAVLHAASIYSLDRKQYAAIRETNAIGTRNVIEAAVAADLDPIVHVSSYGALVPPPADGRIGPDSPVSTGVGPYTTSKAESERIAREYQEKGLPVVTVMPGGVWGPADPYFGESSQLATAVLKGQMRFMPRNGWFPIVDVRDVAEATARIFEPGKGPRRYLMAGTRVSPASMADLLGQVTGKKRGYVPMPVAMARLGGAAMEFLRIVSPWRLPLTRESTRVGTQRILEVDDSRAETELGFTKRPLEETFADTVRWLVEAGHVSPKQAGVLAEAKEPVSV